jgi:hypothetical protein
MRPCLTDFLLSHRVPAVSDSGLNHRPRSTDWSWISSRKRGYEKAVIHKNGWKILAAGPLGLLASDFASPLSLESEPGNTTTTAASLIDIPLARTRGPGFAGSRLRILQRRVQPRPAAEPDIFDRVLVCQLIYKDHRGAKVVVQAADGRLEPEASKHL